MSSVAVESIRYSGEFVRQNAKSVIAAATASASSAVVATAVTKKQDQRRIYWNVKNLTMLQNIMRQKWNLVRLLLKKPSWWEMF